MQFQHANRKTPKNDTQWNRQTHTSKLCVWRKEKCVCIPMIVFMGVFLHVRFIKIPSFRWLSVLYKCHIHTIYNIIPYDCWVRLLLLAFAKKFIHKYWVVRCFVVFKSFPHCFSHSWINANQWSKTGPRSFDFFCWSHQCTQAHTYQSIHNLRYGV